MAKEEKNDNQAPEQAVQQPEPPKTKKSKGLSLPLIIGISLAALLILIGGTLGAVYLMVNNMMQHTNTEQNIQNDTKVENDNEEIKDADFNIEDNYQYLKNVVEKQTKNVRFLEIGEIITNAKQSDKFVVVDIGVEFVAYDESGEVIPTDVESNDSEFFSKQEMARVRSIVNNVIWSNTIEDLQDKRSELPDILKKEFEDIFKMNAGVIKDVIILRFIIQ